MRCQRWASQLGTRRASQLAMTAPVPSFKVTLGECASTALTTSKANVKVASESTSSEIATVGVFLGTGSRHELTDELNGSANFAKQLIFKGLSKEIQKLGGRLHASASREQTSFIAQVLKSDTARAVEILAQSVKPLAADDAAVEATRKEVLKQQVDFEEDEEAVVLEKLHATAFQGTPLARSILGTEDSVKHITLQDLNNYVKANVTGDRVVVVGAGGVEHGDLVAAVERCFAGLPASAASVAPHRATRFTAGEQAHLDEEMKLARWAFAVRGCAVTHADLFPMLVAQHVLGSWEPNTLGYLHHGSQLAHTVANTDLMEKFNAFATVYSDVSLFGIAGSGKANPQNAKLEDGLFVATQELMRLAHNPGHREVERAQNQLKSSLARAVDTSLGTAEDIGRQLLTWGRRLPLTEAFARIDAVTPDDVRRVVQEYVYLHSPAVATYGPVQQFPKYERMESWMEWLRV